MCHSFRGLFDSLLIKSLVSMFRVVWKEDIDSKCNSRQSDKTSTYNSRQKKNQHRHSHENANNAQANHKNLENDDTI